MIIKKLLIPLVSTIIGVSILFYLNYSEQSSMPAIEIIFIAALVGTINGYVVNALNKKLDRWIDWKNHFGWRFITGVLSNFIIIILLSAIVISPFIFFTGSEVIGKIAANFTDLVIKYAILIFFFTIVYNTIYFSMYTYNQYAVTQINALKNDRNQLKLQYEALKSQLSPHYLFNSLNTISSLVYKDANQAENFIRNLAQTYEYVLGKNNAIFVTLQDELDFVKSYNYLLQVRFENNVHLSIDIPEVFLESSIPPLTLQMLVENAVKHNDVSDKNPVYITVKMNKDSALVVENTKNIAENKKVSFAIGLSNIKKRYKLLSNKTVTVIDGEKFTVTLPIIEALNLKSA